MPSSTDREPWGEENKARSLAERDEDDTVDLWLSSGTSRGRAVALFVDETNTVQAILAVTDDGRCMLAVDPRVARVALPLLASSPFIDSGHRETIMVEVPGTGISIEADAMLVDAGTPEELVLSMEETRYILSMVLELGVRIIPQKARPETACLGKGRAQGRKHATRDGQAQAGSRPLAPVQEEIVAIEATPATEIRRRRRH